MYLKSSNNNLRNITSLFPSMTHLKYTIRNLTIWYKTEKSCIQLFKLQAVNPEINYKEQGQCTHLDLEQNPSLEGFEEVMVKGCKSQSFSILGNRPKSFK